MIQTTANPARGGTAWAIVSIGVGVGALMLAFVPYYVGVVAAVVGVAALAAGMVGLLRRGSDPASAAVVGMAVSTVAIVAGIVMTFIYAEPAPAAAPAPEKTEDRSNTATVLDRELTVTIGAYEPTGADRDAGRLPVTLVNRLGAARDFSLTIVAVDGSDQVTSDNVWVSLNAGESKQETVFGRMIDDYAYGRLKGTTFRVISAWSIPA